VTEAGTLHGRRAVASYAHPLSADVGAAWDIAAAAATANTAVIGNGATEGAAVAVVGGGATESAAVAAVVAATVATVITTATATAATAATTAGVWKEAVGADASTPTSAIYGVVLPSWHVKAERVAAKRLVGYTQPADCIQIVSTYNSGLV
jgi:hypothetical protein